MQLVHPGVAQPKLGALRPQVCHCSFLEPSNEPNSRRAPESNPRERTQELALDLNNNLPSFEKDRKSEQAERFLLLIHFMRRIRKIKRPQR